MKEIALQLSAAIGREIIIHEASPLSGGSINEAYCLKTNSGNYFLKLNDAINFPGMFSAEAKGLNMLRETNTVSIPKVILDGETSGKSFIILEMIQPGKRDKNYFENFGRSLAEMHLHQAEKFGLDHNNYIGSLHQSNQQN